MCDDDRLSSSAERNVVLLYKLAIEVDVRDGLLCVLFGFHRDCLEVLKFFKYLCFLEHRFAHC